MDQETQNVAHGAVADEANSPVDETQIAELRANLAALVDGRPHDHIKALVALAEALPAGEEKVELFLEAAELYTNKFKNQAEAVRAYEAVLALDAANGVAIDFLRTSYEKRRDWEKLIALMKLEASRLGGDAQLAVNKEVAQLASDRIKKPQICIELWAVVLASDPNDVDALRALAQLYERDREYERFADVLERLIEFTEEREERVKLLLKLGQVTGDRLKDDSRAAEAYRLLLELEPEDRRYQEQLKKRYLALGRWDDLEMFYAQTERWDEFIRVLESNESRAEDEAQRIAMLMKVAELWMTQKGKPDRAARAYEKILTLDPENVAAADRLVPLYTTSGNAKGLVTALEIKLQYVDDVQEQVETLRQVAELYSGRLADKQLAFERLLLAFELVPEDAVAEEQAAAAAAEVGGWEPLASSLKEALANLSGAAATRVHLRLGQISEHELGDKKAALAHYQAVAEEDPTNVDALTAMERLYSEGGNAEQLLEIYERRLELEFEPAARRATQLAMARLYDAGLGRQDDAVATYQAVLVDEPDDAETLAALDDLLQRIGDMPQLAEILSRRIELESSEGGLAELKYRLARVEELDLGRPDSALEHYREVLLLNQEHVGARQALEGMLSGPLRLNAAAILETVYEVAEDWPALVKVLEIAAAAAADERQAADVLRRIAIVQATQLGNARAAFEAQCRALSAGPDESEVRAEVEHFAGLANAWDDLVVLYSELADTVDDVALSRTYLMRLGEIQTSHGAVDEAAASYGRVLDAAPSDDGALQALDRLFREASRWDDLIGVYRRRLALTSDPAESERLQREMAGIFVSKLNSPEQAIAVYKGILEEQHSAAASEALDALFESQERWGDLADNLESRLGLIMDDGERVNMLLRISALREGKLSDVHAAADGYRQALEIDPQNAAALGALERLSETAEDPLLIAEVLEPIYREQGNYEKLIGVYQLQERRESDPESKVALLQQIAGLQEDALSNATLAFDTYAQALAIDPTNEATLDALERLADLTERHHELASLYQHLGEAAADPELGGQLYMLAADTVENSLRDSAGAIELYRKVLTIDGRNLSAVDALQRLYQVTNQFDQTSLLLQQKARILEDVEDKKSALYQAATIEQDVLQEPARAVGVFHQLLEIDPEDLRSLDALIELYLRLERWPELLDVQNRKADLVFDPEEKRTILYQMGSVYEGELQDAQKAIDTYQRVLELEPDDFQALGRLDALYGASANYPELLGVLTRESELTADAAEAISYQFRIAEVYERHLDDVPRAVELYRDILAIQPMHGPTLARLEAIMQGTVAPLEAANVLEPVYEAAAEYGGLAGVLNVQVAQATDQTERVELLTRLSSLYEDQVGDSSRAFVTLKAAVREDVGNEDVLAAFERLALGLNRWAEVAEVYEEQLVDTNDPETAVAVGMRVGQVYEVQLEAPERAIAQYRAVLELEPEKAAALKALDRLYNETENYEALAQVLRQQARLEQGTDESLVFKQRLGELLQTSLGDAAAAIAVYGEIVEENPEHVGARAALEAMFAAGTLPVEVGNVLAPLYQNAGEWGKLNEVRLAQLERIEDPERRLAVYYDLAQDTEEQLLDVGSAFAVYAAALAEAPLDERTGLELERLAAIIDDGWTEAASTYADVISQEDVSAEVQAELGLRLARVYEEELADPDKATESYRFVLSVSPGEPRALDNLDRIFSSLEEWTDLAEVLELRANTAENDRERIELLCRLGEVYEEQLAQLESAERVYRRIFDDLDGTEPRAIEALSRIFDKREAWPELARVYERQLELVGTPYDEAEVRAKLARLSWDKLGNLEAAAEGWRRVIELRGEDGEALTGLADIYEHQERWPELSDVLERHYDLAESDEERVFALSRRAQLSSKYLGRDDEALETWRRVLEIDFENVAALEAIAAIYRGRNEASELVSALHALVDQGAERLDDERKVAAYRELGLLYSEQLSQPFDAIDAFNHLLEVRPDDLDAIDRAEQLYRGEDNWAEVVRVKTLRADALTEPQEKVRELLEVTELWRHQLENYDGATEALTKIVEAEPLHESAFGELEKLHRAAARWEPLIELYLGRLEHVEEAAARSDLWRRIAKVLEDKLEDNEQAFVALDQSFKENFFDEATADYLGRMAHATGKWKELIASTQEVLERQTEKKAKIQLCLTLGKWNGEELGMTEYAETYYGQVVTLDPSNVRVRRQIASSARLRGELAKAREILEQAEKAAVKNEDLKLVYVDLGDLHRKHLGDAEQGITYYKRALGIDPQLVVALDALEGIYGERGQHSDLADVLRRKIAALSDNEALTEARLRLGELYEQQLGEVERAAEVYAAVVDSDETNLTALRGLERAYRASERWTDLVEVLEKQLHAVQSERDRVELLLKLAAIQEEEFLKFEGAAQRYAQALQVDASRDEAHEGLARCLRRLKRWSELVEALEAHLSEVSSSEARVPLYQQLGQVYAEELNEAQRALDAYREITLLDPTHVPALDALARLYDRQGDAHESIECLTRVAELTSDGATRVDMFYRIGKASLEKLQDTATARERFETALELDPRHKPTLAALRTILSEDGDWEGVARALEQEQAVTETPKARARLLVELGKVRDEYLAESEAALSAYRDAIEADPECEDAALPLLGHYTEEMEWARAEPLAELLVKRSKNKDRSEQHDLYNQMGRVYTSLGKHREALDAYQSAFQLDVTSQTSIRGIADVSYELEDWPTALTNYQKVLTALGDDQLEERTEIYYRLGCIKRAQGQSKQAINNFEKALTINGEHRPTLDALVSVHQEMQDWAQVAEYKRQILDSLYEDDARYDLLLEIAEVWSGEGSNVNKAIEALEEAQDLKPQAHVLLHRLLQLYQRAEEWSKMVDTIAAISELEEAPHNKARYSNAMAQIYRDKLEDPDRAVELFNEALDFDPNFLEAFERINKVLTASRSWKQLERNYRKMVFRLDKTKDAKPELKHELLYQLGLVYRDRLGNLEKAVDAFQMASSIKPDDLRDRQILTELYESTGQFDDAIAQQRFILAQDPLRIEPYRALYNLYLRKRAADEAWCAVSAIAFMQKATEEELAFYEQYKPQGMLRVQGRLNNEHWVRHLLHPQQNVYVSKILEGVAGAALRAKIAQLSDSGRAPDKRGKEDVFKSTITLARTFGWTAQVLGLPVPDLYLQKDADGGLSALPLDPRASVAGRGVLTGFQNHELAFLCGKHLALYRPELYIRTLFPAHAELMVMFFAGVMIAAPNMPVPEEIASNVRTTAQTLVQYMDAKSVEYLRGVVKRFIQDGAARANIKEWNRAAEKTTCRAAYLLCGSLEVARKILTAEQGIQELSAADKMKDLLVFTLSEEYAELRRALGVSIQV